ncbi:MAG: hypothetical protein ACLVJH_19210 [Faecalibacterium prausnitzii]
MDEFIEDTMNGGHQINDRSLVTVMAEESSMQSIGWMLSVLRCPKPPQRAVLPMHKYLHEPEDGSAVGSLSG